MAVSQAHFAAADAALSEGWETVDAVKVAWCKLKPVLHTPAPGYSS